MGCGQVSCSVLPEHLFHVGSVKIRLIDEVFEVNGLEVDVGDGVVEENDVVAVAREPLVNPRRVGRRQKLRR